MGQWTGWLQILLNLQIVKSFVGRAEKFGAIDCLVLNAGISMGEKFEDAEFEWYEQIMKVNYLANVRLVKLALPLLRKSSTGARVVYISSLAGKFGVPWRTGYSASKWAMHGFFNSLRVELQNEGIRITLICPGVVKTDINRTRFGSNMLDMNKGIEISEAVGVIEEAVSLGKREEVFGVFGKIGQVVDFFFPELFDRLLLKTMKEGQVKHQ
eukprot:TRINITY_DN3525_c0_g1_i1.p1 TRINITY_DN3525_c0_g1~~TRINITY_DN3525_c0_g1_i1.p1  ORF type:complete len:212 (-),score=49.31 TRINITY_DN3525_c0_g1_i1:47-682(-)